MEQHPSHSHRNNNKAYQTLFFKILDIRQQPFLREVDTLSAPYQSLNLLLKSVQSGLQREEIQQTMAVS
jgi:hypothetical protein